MRIIAGQHRGKKLLGPADAGTTRPITDRVKQSMFDRLSNADRLEGAVVLDLFSGTGSIGLECLSRGAKHVTFVERDRVALDRLRRNIEAIRRMDDATVVPIDAMSAGLIEAIRSCPPTLVFADPPYKMCDQPRLLKQMQRLAQVCEPGAWMIFRTPRKANVQAVEGWSEPELLEYGSMSLHIYLK